MSDRSLIDAYMRGEDVSVLLNKLIQEGIDPAALTAQMDELNKASAIRNGQQSITDNEVISIRTYGTIEQIKEGFKNKLTENADNENISLSEKLVIRYGMMNANKELPLKPAASKEAPKIDIVAMGMLKSSKREL